jgi:leucyl aminopeptidase (aminopeptidase T)
VAISQSRAAVEGADILVNTCGRLKPGERLVVVCDTTTRDVGTLLAERGRLVSEAVELHEVAPFAMHGQEPPGPVAERMSAAALIMGATAKSMVHTNARRNAAQKGARYLSLPDYSIGLLEHRSLRADFAARGAIGDRIAAAYTAGTEARVRTPAGTDITLNIAGRIGASTPGFVVKPGEMSSPPDIECYVAPHEDGADGVVVVDGSIPYPTLGLIKTPVRFQVRKGRIVEITSPDKALETEVKNVFASAGSDKVYVLAESGVGLNDLAELSGIMLTDEGAAGTMHFGFGSNFSIGGVNEVAFHLDCVMRKPTLTVDGKVVIEGGVPQV